MDGSLRRKLVAGAAAAVVVAAAGGALAATQLRAPREESQAVVNDAAGQLGVEPSKLDAALKKALENRVDAAVEAGRLTTEQGDAIKARIESGELPIFGGPGPRGFSHHGGPFALDAAASYLGLTEAELRSELEDGKSLAQVARDRDKSVDGLGDAMVAEAKQHLDADVEAGRLTQAQADSMLADLRERITDLVNGRFPGRMGAPPMGFDSRPWS